MKPAEEMIIGSFAPEHIVNQIIETRSVSPDMLRQYTPEQREQLAQLLVQKLAGVPTEEKRVLLPLLAEVSGDRELKLTMKEMNGEKIMCAIHNYIMQNGRMPNQMWLAQETGLSRQTVAIHLKRIAAKPLLNEKMGHYKVMAEKVLEKILKQALNGDMKAANIYLNNVRKAEAHKTVQASEKATTNATTQHNYIQLNGIVISQDSLQEMSPEELRQLENIFRARPGNRAQNARPALTLHAS